MIRFNLGRKLPISIHPVFFLIAFFIGWINTANFSGTSIWMGVIFLSIFIHELGHALTALSFGQKVQIEFVALGGLTRHNGKHLDLWKQFLVVLNGPLFGFSLGVIAWQVSAALEWPQTSWGYALLVAMYVNFFWTALNLVPVHPLDGGQLLTIVLEAIFGAKGVRFAYISGFLIGFGLGVLFFINRLILPGILFMLFGFESFRMWRDSKGMTASDRDGMFQNMLKEAETNLKIGNEEAALSQLQILREQAKGGLIYLAATQLLAMILLHRGEEKKVYDLLEPLQNSLDAQGLLALHRAACRLGKWELGAEIGQRAFQAYPKAETAVTIAKCYAQMGEAKPCMGWLQCARREGFEGIEDLIQEPDFDQVRDDTTWQSSS